MSENGGLRKRRYRIGKYPNLSPEGARTIARERAGDVARGIDPQQAHQDAKAKVERARLATLKAYLEGRYAIHAKSVMTTHAIQLGRIKADFADDLNRPLADFTPEWAAGVRVRWQKGDKKLGIKPKKAVSSNRMMQRLAAVLNQAVKDGLLTTHPLRDLKKLKTDKKGASA